MRARTSSGAGVRVLNCARTQSRPACRRSRLEPRPTTACRRSGLELRAPVPEGARAATARWR
eukprot:245817-Alexandrium_andersonii.AAC.1